MMFTLSTLFFFSSFLPSVLSDSTDILLHSNGEGLEDDGHPRLRGRGKGEENQNGRELSFATAAKERMRRQALEIQHRIVGGSSVRDSDKYPFFVHLDIGCGASLIHENILLTAGHCLELSDWDPDAWVASSRREAGIDRRLSGAVVHPDFNLRTSAYDFALLTLETPVPDSGPNGIKPVPINRNRNIPSASDGLTVMGFGRRDYTLQEVSVPFVPYDRCQPIWRQESFTIDDRSMICAGGDRGRDSCAGDSGGPLIDSDGVQVGVVSFGVECGTEGWPAIYSRVSSVIDWIDEFICLHAASIERMPASCGQRCRVHIEINHDRNPGQISWNIRNRDDNSNLIYVPEDPASARANDLYTRTVNLPPGRYLFRILDGAGDGIRGGSYAIRMDCQDTVIERDGDFGEEDTVNFDITDNSQLVLDDRSEITDASSQLALDQRSNTTIRIDIYYDDSPEQTSWALINRETSDVVRSSKYGAVATPGLVSETFEVPDGNYWLFVLDSEGNGIAAPNNANAVEVTMIANGSEFLLASSLGSFDSLADLEFSLP